MRIVNRARGSGKTTDMLLWLSENRKHMMLVADTCTQQMTRTLAGSLGYSKSVKMRIVTMQDILRVISYDELSHLKIRIDDIDRCLFNLFGVEVDEATITNTH